MSNKKSNKEKIIKEFESLSDEDKINAFNFLQFILFKRNIIEITDKYGNTHSVIPVNRILK
jgi:hypothetical protein